VIAIPSDNGGERDPSELDIEHSRRDIALVRSAARQGLLTPDRMGALADRLEKVATTEKQARIRVAADKALVAMQVAMMRALDDSARGSGGESVASVTNQQINIYLPANGREQANGHLANGRNGQH
jgi:hypothetical protein